VGGFDFAVVGGNRNRSSRVKRTGRRQERFWGNRQSRTEGSAGRD
jgi:hypothetical protein